jgi:hypothetical protein
MKSVTARQSRRHTLRTVIGTALAALCLSVATDAGTPVSKRTFVKVNRTMALPGVTLPPGAYTFEVANPTSSANVVQVTGGANHRQVHFLGLTRRLDRPKSMPPDQTLSIGEARAGEPVPITAWYPIGFSSGYQFIY